MEKLIRRVVGLQSIENDPETPISTDAELVSRYFTVFYSKQPLCTVADPIPNIVLHPQFVGTTDSADFQGPIARPVSDDFRHFFTQIATEYDGDPIPTVAEYSTTRRYCRFGRFSGSDRQTSF